MKRFLMAVALCSAWVCKAQVTLTSSNIPVIVINTAGGADVPNEPKIPAYMRIISHPGGVRNVVTDSGTEYSGNIGIELRGQTSQWFFPQKSYSIELRDSTGVNNNNTPLFGLPAESDWVLYAPYTDKTLMRNFLAYQMSLDIGRWASHSRFAELVLNGEYLGIYVLEEKIKRDDGRVKVKKLTAADSTGNALTGGYIFSIDKDSDAWFSAYPTPISNKYIQFTYVYPKLANIIPQQQAYIKGFVDSFENALAGASFQDTAIGFRKFADELSFVDYMIVNEASRNVDAYRLSAFFHKNRNSVDRKIYAGPVWDYNLAFRNADYCDGSNYQTWSYQFNSVCPNDDYENPFWWERLMQDTTFRKNLSCRWKQLRTTVLSIPYIYHQIDSIAALVSEAQVRHFTKWPILGQYVWPNPSPIPTSYTDEIVALKNWIANRFTWMDANLPQTANCTTALPVTLLAITATRHGEDAIVTWQTASEINVSRYVVERSLNGKDFLPIGTEKAAANGSIQHNYSHVDARCSGLAASLFYRILSVDKDGRSSRSNVVAVNFAPPKPILAVVTNPFESQLSLSIMADALQTIQLTIMDATGRLVKSQQMQIIRGANNFRFSTANWPKGVYLVKAILADGSVQVVRAVR